MPVFDEHTFMTTELIEAAAIVVHSLKPSQYSHLHDLASNARQGTWGSESEWAPFADMLKRNCIDRDNYNHVTALLLEVMEPHFRQQDVERKAAIDAARERLARVGVKARRRPPKK
jgi:hypothetical protein